MRISKKILAGVLAALMAISMMPFTAFAYTATGETFEKELSIYGENADWTDYTFDIINETPVTDSNVFGNVRWEIMEDIVVTSPIVIPAGADVQINLNGHSISGNIADEDGKKLFQVSGNLQFIGNNGGCIYNTNDASQGHAACQVLSGGTVIVNAPITFGDSDEIRDNANNVNRGCGIQNNGGTLIINDGYYTAIDANYSTGAWAYAILNVEGDTTINNATVYGNALHGALGCEGGTLIVNDGTFAVNGVNNYYSLYNAGGVITVNGGTFTNNGNKNRGVVYSVADAETIISGGSFTLSSETPFVQKSSKSNPVVTGGTFNKDVSKYLDESCVQDSNGTVVQTYVAKVGNVKYEDLEAAIAAANAGDTVTLIADVDLTAYAPKGQHRIDVTDITIDLGGHTITTSGRWGVIFTGTNATFKNGTMEAIDNSDAPGYQYGIYVWGGDDANEMPDPAKKASATLENVTFNYGIHLYNSEVTIKDCNVTGSSKYYAVWADIEGTANIESGNFTTGGAAVVGAAQYQNTYFGHINISDGDFVVPAGKKLVQTGSSSVPANVIASGGFYHNADGSVYAVQAVNLANGYIQDMTTGEVIANNDVDTMSITVEESVDLNIYVADPADEIETVEFTYNSTPNKEDNTPVTKTVPAKKNADGKIALKVDLAPAQMKDEITVVAKNENGGEVKSFTTSVADYCKTIINSTGFSADLKDLAKATLDYGKAAANYFDYNTAAYTDSNYLDAPVFDADDYDTNAADLPINSVSYVATSVPELRFYIDPAYSREFTDIGARYNETIESNIGTAKFVKLEGTNQVILQIKNIPITDFGKQIIVTYNDGYEDMPILKYTPIKWVIGAQSVGGSLGTLADGIGNYYAKSVAYFEA
ncbi:MAG: hypothetical protein IJR70_03940 [Eubacterium sp.]|nr:hypothetical protein [Eubacterium sp.]